MIEAALKFLYDRIEKEQHPTPIVRKIGHRTQVVTIKGQETLEELEKRGLKRVVNDLLSLTTLVGKFGKTSPTIFVCETGITAILDDEDRGEAIEMKFVYSDQFKELDRLAGGMSQKSLVTLLRTRLAGCIPNDAILAMIRQIEFDVNRNSRGAVSHTSESMGRSIEKQIKAAAGEIPEQILIRLPMFSVPNDVPSEIELVMAVDIDIEAEKIALIPTGNSLSRARQSVIARIIAQIDTMIGEEVILVSGSVA